MSQSAYYNVGFSFSSWDTTVPRGEVPVPSVDGNGPFVSLLAHPCVR